MTLVVYLFTKRLLLGIEIGYVAKIWDAVLVVVFVKGQILWSICAQFSCIVSVPDISIVLYVTT